MKSWCKLFKLYTKIANHLHSLIRTTAVANFSVWIHQCQPVRLVVTWEASLNRCACFCVTSDQVASSGMARSLWTRGWCETRNETKVETICLNQTAITARGDGTIILCQQDANTNTFNSIGRKEIMHENGVFWRGETTWKTQEHTISAKDEHVRAHCPVPNSPRNLQVTMA